MKQKALQIARLLSHSSKCSNLQNPIAQSLETRYSFLYCNTPIFKDAAGSYWGLALLQLPGRTVSYPASTALLFSSPPFLASTRSFSATPTASSSSSHGYTPASLVDTPASDIPNIANIIAQSGDTDEKLTEALCLAATRSVHSLSPAQLTDLTKNLVQVGSYSIPFKDAVADAIAAKLPEFTADQLADILKTFAHAGYIDDELFETVAEHATRHSQKFQPEHIADIVWASSKCSSSCLPDLVRAVESTADRLMEAHRTTTTASSIQSAIQSPTAIAGILDAYARLGCDPGVVEELILTSAANPSMFNATDLSKIIVATVKLGYADNDMLDPMLNAAVAQLSNDPQAVHPKFVVKVIKALADAGYSHNKFLNTVVDVYVPVKLGDFSAKGILDMVDALNKHNYYSSSLMDLLKSNKKISDGGGSGSGDNGVGGGGGGGQHVAPA